jgi:hypothetical protein
MDAVAYIAWAVATCGVPSGFGMSTKAILGRVGVAGAAQLKRISAHKITGK